MALQARMCPFQDFAGLQDVSDPCLVPTDFSPERLNANPPPPDIAPEGFTPTQDMNHTTHKEGAVIRAAEFHPTSTVGMVSEIALN